MPQIPDQLRNAILVTLRLPFNLDPRSALRTRPLIASEGHVLAYVGVVAVPHPPGQAVALCLIHGSLSDTLP